MGEKFLVSTSYEIQNLDDKEKKIAIHLNDNAKKFNFDDNIKDCKVIKNSLSAKKNCAKLTDKIFNQLYLQLINHNDFKISKKAYRVVLAPFLNNFIEIIYYKYQNFDQFISKNKNINLLVLDKSSFIYFDNFQQFISFSQKDFFNTQLNTEIIIFNKYNNHKKVLKSPFIRQKIKKIKNILLKRFKSVKEKKKFDFKKKKIDQIINFYKLDFRHKDFLKKLFKHKDPIKKNLDKIFLNNFKLEYCNQNIELRKKIVKKLKSKTRIDQFIFEMVIKYLPPLYFESVKNNFKLMHNNIKSVPSVLISNAHGWWTDDNFKFYLGFCIENFTKYVDVQHNGTYFVINKNPHYEISKYFRNYFFGWGEACENKKTNIKLPALYNTTNNHEKFKKKINKKNNKIIYMGASIKRYFGGYFQSYLNGGNASSYYYSQLKFFKNLSTTNRKNLILRLRHNERDPRKYMDILKTKFKDINYEDIKIPASKRLAKDDVKVIIVDHCSTPWLEALYANKPLILFWSKSENLIDKKFEIMLNALKKNKIYFDCPIAAAKRLEEITKKDIKWWYKEKKIQQLRKKLLNLFFYSNSKPVKEWNNIIKRIFYGRV